MMMTTIIIATVTDIAISILLIKDVKKTSDGGNTIDNENNNSYKNWNSNIDVDDKSKNDKNQQSNSR